MKILVSAYSCEPNRGSEPGVGWNTVHELCRTHEVWVVTNTRQRDAIEEELAERPLPRAHFVFYDLPSALRAINRDGPPIQVHYYLWQFGVYRTARRLQREVGFDLAYHATFGRYWTPSLFSLLPIPFVWGPVGGGETAPRALRSCLGNKGRWIEFFKDSVFGLSRYDPFLRVTVGRCKRILADNRKTGHKLNRIAVRPMEFMETAVVDRHAIEMIDRVERERTKDDDGSVCFASMTRLLPWKGVHLGLRAFRRLADPRARYWVVGEGPQRKRLEALAAELGIADRVVFWGNPSRAEWIRLLKGCDALVHSSLANTFNTIVIEAMLCGKPVMYFELGAIAEKLDEGIGFPVDCPDPEAAIDGLARAMQRVCEDPGEAAARGERARQKALSSFTWEQRIERLNRVFQDVVDGR